MHPFFDRFTVGVEGIPQHTVYPKQVGAKRRIIYEPNVAMRIVQTRLLKFLRPIAPTFVSSSSKKEGRGAVRNARRHAHARHVFKLDIKDAFPSASVERLVGDVARRVRSRYPDAPGSREEWYEFLSRYALSREGTLPHGATTSSFLFEWYCEINLDRNVRSLLSEWDTLVVYTRYVDDLVFSSYERLGRRRRTAIRHCLRAAGLAENHQKTKIAMVRRTPISITGPRVEASGQVSLPRQWLKDTERVLYQVRTLGLLLSGHNPKVIHGRVLYLLDVLRGKQRLTALEEKILRLYGQFCLMTDTDCGWVQRVIEEKGRGRGVKV